MQLRPVTHMGEIELTSYIAMTYGYFCETFRLFCRPVSPCQPGPYPVRRSLHSRTIRRRPGHVRIHGLENFLGKDFARRSRIDFCPTRATEEKRRACSERKQSAEKHDLQSAEERTSVPAREGHRALSRWAFLSPLEPLRIRIAA